MGVAVVAAAVVGGRRDEAAGFDGGNANGGESVDLAVPAIGDEPTVAPTAERRNAPRRAAGSVPRRRIPAPWPRNALRWTVVHADEASASNAASAAPAPAARSGGSTTGAALRAAAVGSAAAGRWRRPAWVHSDADKVSAVQQAIAAEPKPAHVPRERKVVALPDDGPLVLVETRKDLSQIALPFERQSPPRE